MKKNYVNPALEIVEVNNSDIIATSPNGGTLGTCTTEDSCELNLGGE